jgi:signal peptidase I
MENEEKNQTEQSDKSRSVWRELWDYAKIIIAVFVIAFLLGHFVYINARVPSGSMEETIMTGDRVFGNRLAYIKDDPERFDIVIFKYPDDPSQLFVKRVIGLPSQRALLPPGVMPLRDANDFSSPTDDL